MTAVDTPTLKRVARRRWTLLGIALTVLLAVHFMSERDTAGDHRAEIPAAAAEQLDVTPASADDGTVDLAQAMVSADQTGDEHRLAAGCVLLLAAAAGMLGHCQSAHAAEPKPLQGPAIQAGASTRGSPLASRRLTLCISRV